MFLADFHIHSTYSDGKLTIAQLVDLYGEAGFGAIAITDHLCETNTFLGKAGRLIGHSLTPLTLPSYFATVREQAERAWDQYRMVVLAGVEYTKNTVSNSKSAHILGIGLDQTIDADGDAIDLCRSIRNQGGLAVAAHPVSTQKIEKQTYHLWDRREELRPHFDAWEVASGPYLFDPVVHSGLPMIASSDLHHPRQMRSWKSVLSCERHPEAIKASIRTQEVDFRFYQPQPLGQKVSQFA